MEGIPYRRDNMSPSATIQSSRTIKELFEGRQPQGEKGSVSGEVTTYFKGGVAVTFFNVLHLAHVPMSLCARTSALDEWLRVIKGRKAWIWELYDQIGCPGWKGFQRLWWILILACSPDPITHLNSDSTSAALMLCVWTCAILCTVTFLIQRDLHHAAFEKL